jgi:hypothetical protein
LLPLFEKEGPGEICETEHSNPPQFKSPSIQIPLNPPFSKGEVKFSKGEVKIHN